MVGASVLQRYRRIPTFAAVTVACVVSMCAAIVTGSLTGYVAGLLFLKPDDPFGVTGIPVLLAILNVAIPVFIAVFTVLVNWHHSASWRIPTLAFALCIGLIRVMGSFEIRFAPFMLTSGAIVWLVSCSLLHRKGKSTPEHVLKA